MHLNPLKIGTFFVFAALGLTGCATTSVQNVEADPQFKSQQIHKVLVINMGKDQSLRAAVENEFVRQWKKRGVDAAASHVVLPPGIKLEKGPVAAEAKAQKYDTVLVTRLLGSQKIDPQTQGVEFETDLTQGTTSYQKAVVASPQYADNYRMAAVTTRVYDTQTEKRIWSVVSQTLVTEDVSKLIKPFVKVVLDALYQNP